MQRLEEGDILCGLIPGPSSVAFPWGFRTSGQLLVLLGLMALFPSFLGSPCLSDLFAPPGALLFFCSIVDERNVDLVQSECLASLLNC